MNEQIAKIAHEEIKYPTFELTKQYLLYITLQTENGIPKIANIIEETN